MKESDKNEKYLMKLIDTSKMLYPVAILFGPGDSISFVWMINKQIYNIYKNYNFLLVITYNINFINSNI